MKEIYDWIGSLVFYLILMTMILSLLPDKKYEKYLRLFTGMIFILLVFGPFADLSGLEARMAGIFERLTFQNDAKLLQKEIEDADGKRISKLIDGYREMVETDLRTMAEGISVECISVQAVLDTDMENGEFGRLMEVKMQVGIPDLPKDKNRRLSANREIGNLKKKIGEYYGLEEGNITIHLENSFFCFAQGFCFSSFPCRTAI